MARPEFNKDQLRNIAEASDEERHAFIGRG
jgi:hypothetical protein